jgi:hypothetical protein
MKIIVTTSDNYHHILPVFFYLYNKYWGAPFELVGHAKPECELPDNCTWVSLGEQQGPKSWSTQLRPYFEQQPDWFVWMMEDTFLKGPLNDENYTYQLQDTGRFDLVCDLMNREYTTNGVNCFAHPNSRYRLSTQPSIWNKQFLLQYLTPGLSPWDFETQDPKNDGWNILSMRHKLLHHNEGVRRFDTKKLNLDGMAAEDIDYINKITPWQTK